MLCLDTTFIIDLLKKREPAIRKFNELQDEFIVPTDINAYEIKAGIYRKFDESAISRELESFESFLSRISILEWNKESVNTSAEIHGELSKKGQMIEALLYIERKREYHQQ
mgnify:CR=1 FL=1